MATTASDGGGSAAGVGIPLPSAPLGDTESEVGAAFGALVADASVAAASTAELRRQREREWADAVARGAKPPRPRGPDPDRLSLKSNDAAASIDGRGGRGGAASASRFGSSAAAASGAGGPALGAVDSAGMPLPTTMIGMAAMARGEAVAGADGVDFGMLMRLPRRQLVDEIMRLRGVLSVIQEDILDEQRRAASVRKTTDAARALEDKRMILDQLLEAQRQGSKLSVGHINFIRLMEAGKNPDLEAGDELACSVCMDELALDTAFVVSKCAHIFCFACMRGHVVTQVNSHSLKDLVCMEDGCASELQYCDVVNVLDGAEHAAVLAKYEQFAVEDHLATDPRAVRCPKVECQAMMIKETDVPRAKCATCGHEWCTACPSSPEWHDGSTCEQYQQWLRENGRADEAMAEMLADRKQRIKPCPSCSRPTFKPPRTQGGESVVGCDRPLVACFGRD